MKKLISLLSVALLATSVFAAPATMKKSAVMMTPQEKIQVSQSPDAFDAQISKMTMAPQQTEKVSDAIVPMAKAARALQDAPAPVAFYLKPKGSFYGGLFNDPKYYSYVFAMLYPAVIGANLHGQEFWSWPNYAKNATSLGYKTINSSYGRKEGGWSMNPANGNFQDTLQALLFSDFDYIYSWRMPAQFASNGSVVDTFALIGPKTLRPDTLVKEVMTASGVLNPFNSVDGMWPMTNAIYSTPMYGSKLGAIWDTWKDKEENLHVSYIYGTEPVILLAKVDTIWDTAVDPHEIIKLDSIYDTIQPAMLMEQYEQPMAPLYVKSVSIAATAANLATGKLGDIQIDSLVMIIISAKTGAKLASALATKEDTASMDAIPGQLITFKIQEKDPYGTIIEGVTINEPFIVAINGLSRENNNFGIWSGLDPYTVGKQVAVIDTAGHTLQYAPYNPFIMLNGIFYTLEHAARTPGLMSDKPEYIDTINIAVGIDYDEEMYYASQADGSFEGYVPMLRSTELLYDTVTYKYNYKINAPDWAMFMMDYTMSDGSSWWDEYNAYNLIIWGELNDTSVDAPQVGDEIKFTAYGQQIVFKVVEVEEPTAINNVVRTVNDNKRYNVLGIEVDKDYKGVVIRNGEKFLQR